MILPGRLWFVAALTSSLTAAMVQVPAFTGANFTAASQNPGNAFTAGDWVAPTVTLTAPASDAQLGTATPTLSGAAGTASGDSTTVTVKIYSGSSATGTPVQTRTASATTGSWSVAATSLADGTYTAQATQIDAGGNTGTSAAVTFDVDTTLPTPTVSTPTGYVTSGAPTVTGTASNGAHDSSTVTVEVLSGASVVRTLAATRTGVAWNVAVTPSLADGAYTVRAKQADDALNVGTSAAQAFTVDTTTPAPTVTAPTAAQQLASSTPTLSGAAGTAAGDSATVTVNVYSGATAIGSPVRTASPSGATGIWSTTPAALPDGTYTVQVTQTDAAGHSGQSAAITFDVDTTAPGPTVTAPSGSVRTLSTITGTASNGIHDKTAITVEILSGASVVQTLAATRSGTTWSVAAPSLSDGAYTVRAKQSDDAGNIGTSPALAFTLDTIAPAVSVLAPTAGQRLSSATPAVSGTAGTASGDGTTITVTIYNGTGTGGTVAQTFTRTASGGAWSGTSPALGDGTYTVQSSQSDAAGNTGTSTPVTFDVDTVAPAPTVTAPTGYTTTLPTFSGSASNGTYDGSAITVEVLSGASVVATYTATRSGTAWSITAGSALAQGSYTVRAKQSDVATNTGTSAAIAFTVDTVAPAVTLTAPANGASTNNTTPTLSGAAGTAAGDGTTVTVKIYNGASTGGTVAQTLTANGSTGAWSVAAGTLAPGTYTAQATQADAALNQGSSSANTFTVDTTAPVVAIIAPAAASTQTTATPTISGTAVALAGDLTAITVKVYAGATATGTVLQTLSATAASGAWSVVPASLADGQYTLLASQSDAAGNTGTFTRTFSVDATAPVVTVTTPASGAYTNNTKPPYGGAAGTAAGDLAAITVKVYTGATATGTPTQTLAATASAGAWTVTPGVALAAGTYTVQATQMDAAGNTGTSAPITFTIDTTAPAPTITTPAAGSTQTSATPSITGTAGTAAGDLSTITVKLYTGGVATGTPTQTLTTTASAGAWSVTPTALTNNTYTLTVSQSDSAGNTGTSAARTFTIAIDTTPPIGAGITATNKTGGTAGQLETGDSVTFAFSEPMDPATILAGWNGSGSPSVEARFTNSASLDTFTITGPSGAATVHLSSSVAMNGDFVSANVTATSTLTQVTTSSYKVVFGTIPAGSTGCTNGNCNGSGQAANKLRWNLDTAAKDVAGNAVAAGSFFQQAANVVNF